ncbi:methyltransferase [Nitrososphaera viennensis]|uniref:O-methyltransferase, family 2 n=2 Tax=Nitrososphaera viennensis TaxID=1034015 RepID=A0A060HMC5_9ARCH|nr:methyltransferase [Nitrososphaera viennensis]AIC16633.1 O-methyltransferase, family 2 [Nitrososphaera viennensis EN76]UVS68559.1 acetylserotonin O-methyltransferase [Nitrososphaera viennensis]
MSDYEKVIDTILGRWRSQILYTGVKLGIFESLGTVPKHASEIARELGLDASLSYRLLRALASIGFLNEKDGQSFSITPLGELVRKDHPQTLRGVILLEEGPEHYSIWKHLVDMVRDGKQDGFIREFGLRIFDYIPQNPAYAEVFNYAMSSYSATHTKLVLEALKSYDFSNIRRLCDIGGGHGHLICNILQKHPQLQGTVLELESTIKNKELLWAEKMGMADRCKYLAGDMFQEVPSSDAYIMKMILHDWNDEECVKILSNIQRASPAGGRILVVEHVVPGPEIPHFSKLFDIHMMCALTGRERTEKEYAVLLEKAGLQYVQTHYPQSKTIGVIEGIKR